DGIRDLIVTGVQTCALPIFFSGEQLPRLFSHQDLFCEPQIALNNAETSIALFPAEQSVKERIQNALASPAKRFDVVLKAQDLGQIGRASCRERGESAVVAGP